MSPLFTISVPLSRSEIKALVRWHQENKRRHALADEFDQAIDEKARAEELDELVALK